VSPYKSLIALLTAFCLLLSLITPWANAQPASPAPGGGSGGIKTICPNPGVCFKNKEAKDNWAKDNKCQFLEDVCEKTPANQDDKGSKPEDAGFWSGLWNNVAGAVKYGYEFGKGLFTGLKEQVTDIIDLISDPLAVAEGLVTLGKAFYDDPKGTLAALAELLGQEAVDTITKATACGAYDLGKVIGTYVSPAVALKLAAKLAKFTGKIADAVKATKLDLGCASFIAGTPIHTPQGMSLIERITAGSLVDSRDESRWNDKPQAVSSTFGRTAPSFRQLQTELETLSLTDEHPLWVQGKGWTQAKDVVPDDILATLKGDVLVRTNTVVAKAVQVYNFSVANTPNYFVGEAGVWAHNAKKCELGQIKSPGAGGGELTGKPTKIPPNETPENIRGLTRENESADILAKSGYKVEQNPKVDGSKNPDYRINGEIFDNYAPSTGNVRNIADVVKGKVDSGQANNIVVNLADSPTTSAALQVQLANYPIPGLQQIIIIDKSGQSILIKF
jgi:Contact-dependent growth inhibition CdiA C-terminal domain/Pretoxin HINT domain